ncbi:MAG: hypothetical protein GYB65_05230 [Chloroflexi bacterium]|nr:hypothetical protein [Chloroflexota bacterium]
MAEHPTDPNVESSPLLPGQPDTPDTDDEGQATQASTEWETRPFIDEPPVEGEDTRPQEPASELPPEQVVGSRRPPYPPPQPPGGRQRSRVLLTLLVLLSTTCLCITLLGISGLAGYRDGLATNDHHNTQTMAAEVAFQYNLGVAQMQSGTPGAADRFEWIITTAMPNSSSQYVIESTKLWSTAIYLDEITSILSNQYYEAQRALAQSQPEVAYIRLKWIVDHAPPGSEIEIESTRLLAQIETQLLADEVATQYWQGRIEIESGNPATAAARYEWIVATVQAPTEIGLDSVTRWALAQTAAAQAASPLAPPLGATPSPGEMETTPPLSPAASVLTVTAPPETPLPATVLSETEEAAPGTATSDPLDPDRLYQQANTSMMFADYEDALATLETLQRLYPDFRQTEVETMYLEALINQAEIYLRDQNVDGGDMLMRGVRLAQQAAELGDSSLLFDANFAESYLNARSYINGGLYAEALPILIQLCEWNCDWTYNGVSVRDLLERAQSGS